MIDDPSLLPPGLARLLAAGSTGRTHLARLANAALTLAATAATPAQSALLLEMGADFLLEAWECDPLDGRLANLVLSLAHKLPILPPPVQEALQAVAGAWREPDNPAYLERLAGSGDTERLARYLADKVRREPDNLAWPQRLARLGLETGDLARVRAALDGLPTPALQAAVLSLRADAALAAAPEDAVEPAAAAAAGLPLPGSLSRLARARLAAGEREPALATLRRSLAARPWRSSDRLLLHGLTHGTDQASAPLPGRVRVLLAGSDPAALDATLAALVPEMHREDRISALALGSPEAADLLRAWQERLGSGRMAVEELLLDPGRPAARNWLLARADTRGVEGLLFADPGAVPERGWSGRLGAALAAHPEAAAAGCRILAANTPQRVLAADGGLLFGLDDELGEHTAPGGGRVLLAPADLHADLPDLGRFAYTRPCLYASGAFLLVRTAALAGERYDLRFSPWGLDDTDLCLRLALAGKTTVCAGHLAATAPVRDLPGVEPANLYKLQMKFSAAECARLAEIQQELLAPALAG